MSRQPTAAKAKPQKAVRKRVAEPAKPKGKARAKPRAKAKAKPETIRRKLVWRGVLLAIHYQPKSYGLLAHLELRVIAPEGAPIPVTDTGYRSHFLYPFWVREAGGPVAYVRQWLDGESRSPAYRRALDRWRQLDLFGALEEPRR